QGEFRGGNRFARHWHDIARLDASGFADSAIRDRDLASAVARHKAIFFAEKDSQGAPVDYSKAVSGALQLVPRGAALERLARDYQGLVEDGLLLEEAEPFGRLMDRCREVQMKANGR
ncbi:MAG: nucleotidyl transferase AbiEii/AbiGii toxin family protein, partial [Acidobacteria bacterium]|nr:nucleotidyl transferase AbiEii/AbiGii toxin family protein [Acidobacteriota bacterium]